jgi:hypothetical protein
VGLVADWLRTLALVLQQHSATALARGIGVEVKCSLMASEEMRRAGAVVRACLRLARAPGCSVAAKGTVVLVREKSGEASLALSLTKQR